MLHSTNELEGYAVGATDGAIGHVNDFYFDDAAWVVRYLVVETGEWLMKRNVLISPVAIGRPDWAGRVLPVSITKEQVKNSPDIDTAKPVSRQQESAYLGYYGYPNYWGAEGNWSGDPRPAMMLTGLGYGGADAEYRKVQADCDHAKVEAERHRSDDRHLRSCREVMSYHIHATDGDIGHVFGLLLDEETWSVRFIVVDTSNWWSGHQMLIAPQWIQSVSWPEAKVLVDLKREEVRAAPSYDAAVRVDRQREAEIYQHYGRAGYWTNNVKQKPATSLGTATESSNGQRVDVTAI
jgi:uncharacterized protein YrrD